MKLKIIRIAAAMSFLFGASIAQAQESTNQVAEKGDWLVFVESNPTECWAVSTPTKTEITKNGRVVAARRSDILLFTFFRPSSGVSGQMTFTGGYPFAKGSRVTLRIGSDEFTLYTEGEWAWAESAQDDQKIVAAMRKGAQATLIGRSARGSDTKDIFSLSGFTAALEDAQARCSG